MKSLIRIAALTLLMFPALVSAQEPQHPLMGTWSATIQEAGAAEPSQIILEFRIQGDVVTGPIFANGFERYIKQGGTVTANTISFTSPGLNENDQESLVWTGQLSGDNQLSFSVTVEGHDGQARELTLTRHVVEQ